jgi:hypothetical protein
MFVALKTTEYSAMAAEKQCISCTQRMRSQASRMPTSSMCSMWATAGAAASILLIQTGVSASVSLFVLLITLHILLLVTLVGLLGPLSLTELLSLSGLTRQIVSLVGLFKGLSPGTETGE